MQGRPVLGGPPHVGSPRCLAYSAHSSVGLSFPVSWLSKALGIVTWLAVCRPTSIVSRLLLAVDQSEVPSVALDNFDVSSHVNCK